LTVLGLGCLAYGGVGLYLLLDKNLTPLRRLSFISTLFYVVLGALIILHVLGVGTLATVLQIISLLLITAGIILFFWGIILRNERPR
jgi:predicted membrane channel-forming protein YqfA (hemolysin III family)